MLSTIDDDLRQLVAASEQIDGNAMIIERCGELALRGAMVFPDATSVCAAASSARSGGTHSRSVWFSSVAMVQATIDRIAAFMQIAHRWHNPRGRKTPPDTFPADVAQATSPAKCCDAGFCVTGKTLLSSFS